MHVLFSGSFKNQRNSLMEVILNEGMFKVKVISDYLNLKSILTYLMSFYDIYVLPD